VLLPGQRWKLARGANDEEHAMFEKAAFRSAVIDGREVPLRVRLCRTNSQEARLLYP
jgi:hypothetical protein